MLDLESVRLFVLAAEFGNLTRAAEAAGTVQPVVSQRLKNLEATLGRKLLDRTPRFVRITPDGEAFLDRARALLSVHDQAVHFAAAPAIRFAFGASDHALGTSLEFVLRKLRSVLPAGAALEVRLGLSHRVRELYDSGDLDAALIRRDGGGPDGEVLGTDEVGWRAPDGWHWPQDQPVPLATLGSACGVRGAAIRQLETAGIAWRESFVAGSCTALLAGVRAGLGTAPMGVAACGDMRDRGPELGLPRLPSSEIVLLSRASSPAVAAGVRGLAAAVRSGLR